MAFNGSGTFNLPTGNPVVVNTTVDAAVHNNTNNEIATALSNCVTRDGQSPPTGSLPMAGFKLTGLGAGTGNGESVRYEQTTLKTGATGSTLLAVGTTAQRDGSPLFGYTRANSDLLRAEWYNGTAWAGIGGGAVGGGSDTVFVQNDSVVTTAFNIGQDAQISGAVFTLTNPTIAFTAHGMIAGSEVCFTTTGALPTGFAIGTKYYVIATGLTANALQVSATYGGAAITPTVSQSGTHSMGKVKNATVAGPITFLATVGSTGGRLTIV